MSKYLLYLSSIFLVFSCSKSFEIKKQTVGKPQVESFHHLLQDIEDEDEEFLKGMSLPLNPEESLLQQAQSGDTEAQLTYAIQLLNGSRSISPDLKEAFKWFHRAAKKGNLEAQYYLGMMYHNAKGTARDYHLAFIWYRRAAQKGHPKAQNALGYMYESGLGTHKDNNRAVYWYEKAAKQNYSPSQYNLGLYYYEGKGGEQEKIKAKKWLKKASDQGNDEAKKLKKRLFEY